MVIVIAPGLPPLPFETRLGAHELLPAIFSGSCSKLSELVLLTQPRSLAPPCNFQLLEGGMQGPEPGLTAAVSCANPCQRPLRYQGLADARKPSH